MLTKRQKQVYEYIKKYTKKKGHSLTQKEIGKHFGLAKSTVHQHIETLKEKGKLDNQARAIEIKEDRKLSDLVKIPLLGMIAAGEPIEAIENRETIKVQKSLLSKSGEHYALQVQGNSMVNERICDGDTVVIRKQPMVENGETAVALINGNEVTLKKIYKEKNGFRLQPANLNIKPIFVKELTIQGRVISVIRNFEELKNNISGPIIKTKRNNKIDREQTFKKWLNTIQHIDCIEGMKNLPDESIDLILTDPPYGLNKEGVNNDSNLDLFYSILPESHRVLKDNSFFITFFSTKFLPAIFENNPFQYFWNFVLYCPNGQVMSPIGFTKYMSCVVFKKGNPKMVKRGKDIFVDTPGKMIEPDEGFINHPTPKPKTFIKEILNMFSKESDIILDPFVGSGSTAVACKILKRNYIGFEINPDYCKLSEHRINKF